MRSHRPDWASMQGYGASSYGDAFADVYDDWYAELGDVSKCVEAVCDVVGDRTDSLGSRGLVLELGVGTGRLAVPLQQAGIEVVGLDASSAMLAQLATNAAPDHLPAVQGDMARLPLRGPFTCVLVGFNTLFNLTTEAAQRALFREVARVLAPGGFFVAELFVPAREDDVPDAVVEPAQVSVDRVVLTASIRDRAAQVVEGQHIEITEAGIRLRPWSIRYASPDQLDEMATAAGLALAHRHGSWDGAAFTEQHDAHVSWWQRPF